MSGVQLLAVVEVPREKRVICQSEGCGHSVYKRIHVVRANGKLIVLGSECYAKLFGASSKEPYYSSSAGRSLTEDERRMLLENTEELVSRLEQETKEAQARQAPPALAPAPPAPPLPLGPAAPRAGVTGRPLSNRLAAVTPTPEELARYESQAKRDVAQKYRVNPDLPGWRGLVIQRVLEIARPFRAVDKK